MKKWILCCWAGIFSVGFSPKLPDIYAVIPLVCIFILSLKFRAIRLLGAFAIGLVWALIYGWSASNTQLHSEDEGQTLRVQGYVTGMPKQYSHYQRFDFIVEHSHKEGGEQLTRDLKKIRINWYQIKHSVTPGEYWQFEVRLKKPHGYANPGGFDYETWLFRNGIGATGYVRSGELDESPQASLPTIQQLLAVWRYRILQKLKDSLAGLPHGALLLALTMGEKADIPSDRWQLFSKTGTTHLFVISGLHVGFVAGCAYAVGLLLGRLLLTGSPGWTVQQTAACLAILGSIFYALLAGFSLPTQRALIMIIMMLSGRLLKKEVQVWNGFCLALLLVFVIDPLAAESKGFWLSFLAVAALIYSFHGRTLVSGLAWRWLRPQWIVFIALGPVLLISFQQLSVVSPLANSLAVPVVGLLLVPLCLLALLLLFVVPSLGASLYSLLNNILDYLIKLLIILEKQTYSSVSFSPDGLSIMLAVIGTLILLSPKGLPARWLGLCCFLPSLMPANKGLEMGQYSLTILDVGQGLSVVVNTKNHNLIYDVGAQYSEAFNMADAVILPFLKTTGITRVDKVVISHSDNDHAGALLPLLEKLPVDKIISGTPMNFQVKPPVELCQSGFSWEWDAVQFKLMQAVSTAWSNENNQSCVLSIRSGQQAVLLTGDIEKEAETALMGQFPNNLQSNVLVVPHHGSLTSSSEDFITTVLPDYAVFTTGYKNRFGHPHEQVVERFQTLGVPVMNTVSSGAITFTFNGGKDGPEVNEFRHTLKRYWY